MVRLSLVAVETALACRFWGMYSSSEDYGMSTCRPWPLESITYGGLCSHSAFTDPVAGNFDLSAEDLDLLTKQAKERAARRKSDEYLKALVEDVYAAKGEPQDRHDLEGEQPGEGVEV